MQNGVSRRRGTPFYKVVPLIRWFYCLLIINALWAVLFGSPHDLAHDYFSLFCSLFNTIVTVTVTAITEHSREIEINKTDLIIHFRIKSKTLSMSFL
jgi:hypothetical protein